MVREFAKLVDVWRVYHFLNHVPNMVPVFEEVQRAGRLLMPSICFSTGKEHTDDYYVEKAGEILDVTGPDVILSIKNFAGLGTPKRVNHLVKAIINAFPGIILHYHGCNTDANDIGRMTAVLAGAKLCDVSDHGYGSVYGQAPALTLIQNLKDYGKKAIGINIKALLRARTSCAGNGKSTSPSTTPTGVTTPRCRTISSPAARWAPPMSRPTRGASWTGCRKFFRNWAGCRWSWATGGR